MSIQITENANRVFLKSIGLLESRLGLKVKNAVMILDTDFGNVELIFKDDPMILTLVERFLHQRMMRVILNNNQNGLVVTCSKCMGGGEVEEGGMLITCSKCKGGGEVVRINSGEQHYEQQI